MTTEKVYRAIGLMSGTSLDGIDAALVETDGRGHVRALDFVSRPYEPALRAALRACLGRADRDAPDIRAAEEAMTGEHATAVKELLQKSKRNVSDIDVIGFHGQTILHAPEQKLTIQIGDGTWLARETGIDVVCDMRQEDIRHGGQGAPFLPLYHRALADSAGLLRPLAVLNIGGVANVTWLGKGAEDILAFDTGPGNALMDDFMALRRNAPFDENGALAELGDPDSRIIRRFLADPYFQQLPPKSLDRDRWTGDMVSHLSDEDGMATLLACTTGSLEASEKLFPAKPKIYLVTGGGRKNRFLMCILNNRLSGRFWPFWENHVKPVEAIGWNGDAIEAEGFAYLAVRSLLGLPLSLPSVTGIDRPRTGGVLSRASGG